MANLSANINTPATGTAITSCINRHVSAMQPTSSQREKRAVHRVAMVQDIRIRSNGMKATLPRLAVPDDETMEH